MSDIYDVENAIAILAQAAIYPNGITSPSITNTDVRIYPGWPLPQSLDNDLAANKSNISIYPTNYSRCATKYNLDWLTQSISEPSISLTLDSTKTNVTITGSISVPQTLFILINKNGYHYSVQQTDTLNTIASNFSQRIPMSSASGNVITLYDASEVSTAVSVSGVNAQEVAREERVIQLTLWTPSPSIRSSLGNAIAEMFGDTFRIVMPDGFIAQIKFRGTKEEDILEKVNCYRRNMFYLVEYVISNVMTNYTVADNRINLSPSPHPQLLLLDNSYFVLMDGELFGLLGN